MIKRTLLAPVLTMCFVQIISTALITYIFPFVASLLLSMNVPEREVPIWAGWADSMISVADVMGLPIHVRLIRHFPHRHLFVFTLLSSGTVAAMVGFCTSPWQLIALRGLTGLVHFGGFISVIALGGLVDEESRNEAFSWRAAGSSIGSMSGSALGGLLSEPNGRIPLFSDIKVFQVNPYAAPGVLLLLLSMIASASVILLVKETNPRFQEKNSVEDSAESLDSTSSPALTKGKLTTGMLSRSGRFFQVSLSEFTNRACAFACLALLSTAGKLSPSIGGLGLEITDIAQILSIMPLLTLVNLLFLFPWYSKHLSLRVIGAISSGGWLLPAAFFPIAAYFATHPEFGPSSKMLYGLWYVGQVGGMTWWTLQALLLLRLYPNPDDRTLATGIIRLASNAGMITGSLGSTRMFSIATHYPVGTLGRQLAWIFLGGLAVLTFAVGLSQPKREGADPILKLADSRAADEETSLLRNEEEDGE